ncbi:hypothetical protein HELRODRAFT_85778 [Helobdella robusta]|uniref:VHS domain-containing protein n=1 Tax=Helobdella robusta TaxID=6412 RepID=T1G628_HELRO|nr:hypothetical protein HELRODRAFT_85778 [Helobdella robusta]ESN97210.1 hypothetical protein HELRODRAFT_85778 [Helobdella robusta]
MKDAKFFIGLIKKNCFVSKNKIDKATNPLMLEENWEHIVGFCDMVNKDVDGPQMAVRLLVHKIQSPQEKESLFALTVLEACVKNCGTRFQQEVGKFRFINEIIKVISPKYLGNQMSLKVKNKCIILLYVWSQSLSHEPKIKEAYTMLKRQGVVKEDPDIFSTGIIRPQPSPPTPPPPPPVPKKNNSVFEDEEKSKLLSRLLKSKNLDDLQAANRLIKNMVRQDAERVEKVTRRTQQLETVSDNVKLLSEMLQNYQPGDSTESDREIMKELSENIEKQRPALFKLASDSDEKENSGIGWSNSIELSSKNMTSSSTASTTSSSLLPSQQQSLSSSSSSSSLSSSTTTTPTTNAIKQTPFATSPPSSSQNATASTTSAATATTTTTITENGDSKNRSDVISLEDVIFPLESFRPNKKPFIEVYNQNNVRITFHFSDLQPKPNVHVIAVTTTSTSPSVVKDFCFLATVSKPMRAKMQTGGSGGREFKAYNPILPPDVVTQLLFVGGPLQEPIKLKYKVSYTLDDDDIILDVGEVNLRSLMTI